MKQTFKNFKFYLAESDRPRYHKVDVTFTVDGERYQESFYIKNNGDKKDQYYIDEAKKQVEKHTGQNLNPQADSKKVKKEKKDIDKPLTKEEIKLENYKKYYGDKRPAIKALIAISAVAVICIGLFIWQFFFNNTNSGGGGKGKDTTISLAKDEQYITLSEEKIMIGEDYNATITMKEQGQWLDKESFSVYCLDDPLNKADYKITLKEGKFPTLTYDFFISGSAINGAITIANTSLAEDIEVKLDKNANPDEVDLGVNPTAHVGYDYHGRVNPKGTIQEGHGIDPKTVKVTIATRQIDDIDRQEEKESVSFTIKSSYFKKDYPIEVFAALKS